ncbi:MAG: SDR family NAD(P)-dependent oxidoreductase [Myxococcales bacterium]|nr:SDR family NAD(P)-dependent oxidoreductase [Myxococcales bacterium]
MALLDGQVALITGGSRGLGRALCEVFAREGATVAFTWRSDAEAAAATLAAIEAQGARGFSFQTSVTDREATRAMVKTIEKQTDGIHILVNNAGVGQVVPLALMEEEDWDRLMTTNVKGAFLTSQAVLRGMIRRRAGRILNIGSLAGTKMMQAPVHYCAAKAALRGFTEALAKEVGRYGITVNCLAPGVLEEGVSGNLPEKRLAEYLRNCALGRVGTFAECAEVAAFLVSARNSYMSGATIVVDGAV